MLIDGDRQLLRFKASWQTVRHEDLLGLLAIRSQLLDHLAAGHIMGDTQRLCSARDALLGHAVVFLERFQPINEILIVELSLALTAKRQLIAKTLSTAILSRDIKGTLTLDNFQALSLASLVSKDYPGAQNIAVALTEACNCGAFDKLSCTEGMLWGKAIQHFVVGDSVRSERAVHELQQLHISRANRELGKLKRGSASNFQPFDMLDLPSAALLALIEVSGQATYPLSEAAHACGYALGVSATKLHPFAGVGSFDRANLAHSERSVHLSDKA